MSNLISKLEELLKTLLKLSKILNSSSIYFLFNNVMEVPAVYLRIACDMPVDYYSLEKLYNAPLYSIVGSLLKKEAAISLLDYSAESCY
jgi:hypothetical protein